MSNPIPLSARKVRARKEVHELICEIEKARRDAKTWRARYETTGDEKALRQEQRAQGHLVKTLEELEQFREANKDLLTDDNEE